MDGGGLREGDDRFIQIDRELDVQATFYVSCTPPPVFIYLGADCGFLVGTLCRGTDYSHRAASCGQKRTSYCLNCPDLTVVQTALWAQLPVGFSLISILEYLTCPCVSQIRLWLPSLGCLMTNGLHLTVLFLTAMVRLSCRYGTDNGSWMGR